MLSSKLTSRRSGHLRLGWGNIQLADVVLYVPETSADILRLLLVHYRRNIHVCNKHHHIH